METNKLPGINHPAQRSLELGDTPKPPPQQTAPWFFSRLAPLKPTAVFDTYWRFAAERQAVFFRRYEGGECPWTKDPILQRHKFTNAYRASDRVSQFLIDNVIYSGSREPIEVFFRTILFKLFNKIETWLLLADELGKPTASAFEPREYSRVLSRAMERGETIYSGAYIMPPAASFRGDFKHDTHLALLQHMLKDGAADRVLGANSSRSAFAALREFAGIGDFLAYQFSVDLNYSEFTDFSENDFVVPGPGALSGIRKCFTDLGGLSEPDVIRVMVDRQQAEFDRLELDFRDLWGRPLHLIDCQNLFCEVDKYARVAHPEFTGAGARHRIKQHFRPLARLQKYLFPPKWGMPSSFTVRNK